METMHAAGRRTLPPVPRAAAGTAFAPVHLAAAVDASVAALTEAPSGPVLDGPAQIDLGQAFVARLRAAAARFAAEAGAESAVVREVVPPARHRRSRCRVVLRQADGSETDLTLIGDRRRPGTGDHDGLDVQISAWLAAGRPRDAAWLVADPDTSDGLAVDLSAWAAGG